MPLDRWDGVLKILQERGILVVMAKLGDFTIPRFYFFAGLLWRWSSGKPSRSAQANYQNKSLGDSSTEGLG
jgi:hypothetical protein